MNNLTKIVIGVSGLVVAGALSVAYICAKKARDTSDRLNAFCNEAYKLIIEKEAEAIEELQEELKAKESDNNEVEG